MFSSVGFSLAECNPSFWEFGGKKLRVGGTRKRVLREVAVVQTISERLQKESFRVQETF